jgi:hypothetical protein
VYIAKTFFEANVLRFIPYVFDVGTIFYRNFGGAGEYYQIEERLLTSLVRIAYSAILLLFALAGFLISYRKKASNSNDKMMLMALAGVYVLSAVLVYGGELFMRLWFLGLPMIAYFIAKNFSSRKTFIVLAIFFLAVAPAMNIWARYGAEKFDYIPASEIEGDSFVYVNVPYGYWIGGNPWGSFRNSYDRYKLVGFNFFYAQHNVTSALANLEIHGKNWPLYLGINRGEREYYRRMYNASTIFEKIEFDLDGSPYYYRIYSNPDFNLFITKRLDT